MFRVGVAKLLVTIVASAFALLAAQAAHASDVASTHPLAICIAPEGRYATPAAAFAGSAYDCSDRQYRHGPGDFWALSAPIPREAGDARQHLHVRVGSVWQRALTLHALYADGAIATIRTTSATMSKHVELGATFDFALPHRAVPVQRLLWRVEGAANARGVLIDQRIVTAEARERANLAMAAMYSAFGGLAIALLVYNLAIWTALRHRFQIAYCAMVGAMLVYGLSSSGALAWLMPGVDNNVRISINYSMLCIAAASALTFARTFFEPQVFGRWMRGANTAAIALLMLNGALFWPLSRVDMGLADCVYNWVFLFALGTIVPMLWQAWRRGSRYLWLFAVAWATPILFSLARVLASLHIVPRGFWLDNSTVLTLALESLLSSLAIAYRIQMLSRERDEAVAGEALARRLADADPLTGLINRRAFLAQAIGRPGPQALHIIDVDRFKAVNDTLGHDGGDEVLRLLARTLRASVPAGALVARLGGEEFAILTDAFDPVDPERILARLRAARMPFDLTVTASIGSCTGPLASDVDWKRLYHNADRALFQAKAAGRDRAREGVPVPLAA